MDQLRKTPKIVKAIICLILIGFLMRGIENIDFNRKLGYFKQDSYILKDEELRIWDLLPSRFNLSYYDHLFELINSTMIQVSFQDLKLKAANFQNQDGVCTLYYNRRYGSIWVFENRPYDSVKNVYYWQHPFARVRGLLGSS